MRTKRTLVGASIAILLAATTLLASSGGAATPAARSASVQAGADWLAARFTAGGFIPDVNDHPDFSNTAQSALALAASASHQSTFDAAVAFLQAHVDDYVGAPGGDDSVGALGYLLLLADAAGVPGTDFGGENLVARLQATLGDFAPGLYGATDPSFDGTFRQGLAVLGLVSQGVTPDATAITWLTDQQCTSGGWEAYRADVSVACGPPDPVNFIGPDSNSTAARVGGVGRRRCDATAGCVGLPRRDAGRRRRLGFHRRPRCRCQLDGAGDPSSGRGGGEPRERTLARVRWFAVRLAADVADHIRRSRRCRRIHHRLQRRVPRSVRHPTRGVGCSRAGVPVGSGRLRWPGRADDHLDHDARRVRQSPPAVRRPTLSSRVDGKRSWPAAPPPSATSAAFPPGVERSAGDGGADAAELARCLLAEERDGDDANDGDERHEQGVLDERGPPIGLATAHQPGPGELIGQQHSSLPPSGTPHTGPPKRCQGSGVSYMGRLTHCVGIRTGFWRML